MRVLYNQVVALAALDVYIGAVVLKRAVDAGYIAAHCAVCDAVYLCQACRGGKCGMANRLKDCVKTFLTKQL